MLGRSVGTFIFSCLMWCYTKVLYTFLVWELLMRPSLMPLFTHEFARQNIYGLFLDFLLQCCIFPNFSALCVRAESNSLKLVGRLLGHPLMNWTQGCSSSSKVFCYTAWLKKSRSITPRRGLD